jgi:hypothetical protein
MIPVKSYAAISLLFAFSGSNQKYNYMMKIN